MSAQPTRTTPPQNWRSLPWRQIQSATAAIGLSPSAMAQRKLQARRNYEGPRLAAAGHNPGKRPRPSASRVRWPSSWTTIIQAPATLAGPQPSLPLGLSLRGLRDMQDGDEKASSPTSVAYGHFSASRPSSPWSAGTVWKGCERHAIRRAEVGSLPTCSRSGHPSHMLRGRHCHVPAFHEWVS